MGLKKTKWLKEQLFGFLIPEMENVGQEQIYTPVSTEG